MQLVVRSWIGFLLLLICAMSTASDTSIDEVAPTIHLACTSFPPWKIPDSEERPGIDIDIISEAFQRAGVQLKTTFLPWRRSYFEVVNGNYDGLCGCSWQSDREELFYYSAPVSMTRTGFFTQKGKSIPIGLNQFPSEMTVGVVSGYSLEAELTERSISFEPAVDEGQLTRMLAAGRLDSVYSFRAPILWHASSLPAKPQFEFTEIRSQPNYICFDKKNQKLKPFFPAINDALLYMQRSGRSEEISQSYQ